ncbi:hypothetical protein PIB30_041009, partial [Stylosanthes scabra]|nr:hypothetical protein [Stylosanthes scabra]
MAKQLLSVTWWGPGAHEHSHALGLAVDDRGHTYHVPSNRAHEITVDCDHTFPSWGPTPPSIVNCGWTFLL